MSRRPLTASTGYKIMFITKYTQLKQLIGSIFLRNVKRVYYVIYYVYGLTSIYMSSLCSYLPSILF